MYRQDQVEILETNVPIEMPKKWDEVLRLDDQNGNYYWQDEIENDMKTISIAYHPYHHKTDGEVSPKTVKSNPNMCTLLASTTNKLCVTYIGVRHQA